MIVCLLSIDFRQLWFEIDSLPEVTALAVDADEDLAQVPPPLDVLPGRPLLPEDNCGPSPEASIRWPISIGAYGSSRTGLVVGIVADRLLGRIDSGVDVVRLKDGDRHQRNTGYPHDTFFADYQKQQECD